MLDQSALLPSARKLWHILRSLLAGIGVILVLITFTPVLGWWAAALAGPWGDGRGKVLIVTGETLSTSRNPWALPSYWRSVYAVFCWRTGNYQTLVFSGRNLAAPMRDFVVAYRRSA